MLKIWQNKHRIWSPVTNITPSTRPNTKYAFELFPFNSFEGAVEICSFFLSSHRSNHTCVSCNRSCYLKKNENWKSGAQKVAIVGIRVHALHRSMHKWTVWHEVAPHIFGIHSFSCTYTREPNSITYCCIKHTIIDGVWVASQHIQIYPPSML